MESTGAMITAVGWVRRGVARASPARFQPTEEQIRQYTSLADEQAQRLADEKDVDFEDDDEEEMDEEDAEAVAVATAAATKAAKALKKQVKEESKAVKQAAMAAVASNNAIPPELAEYRFDDYNEDGELPLLTSLKGLQFHQSNEEDPYITMQENSDDEDDDLTILPSDRLVLSVKTEDDISNLEVNIYEEADDNLYTHHDVMLPSFPLCLEWINYEPSTDGTALGNFAAIGTFEPEIEIWDLDVVDALFPHTVLARGTAPAAPAKSGKKGKKGKSKDVSAAELTGHTDAVLGLAWNAAHRNLLASCSADKTIRLWDLKTAQSVAVYSHHADKVQSIRWNPTETTVLAAGGYDHAVTAWDTRAPGAVARWAVTADVESLRWNPHNAQYLAVAAEDGSVTVFDVRNHTAGQAASVFRLQAHDRACTTVDFHPLITDCMVTASFDQTVKIWDTTNLRPALVHSRNVGIGKLFNTSVAPDAAFLVATAGDKGPLTVWNAWDISAVRERFSDRLDPAVRAEAEEQLAAAGKKDDDAMSDDE